MKLNQIKSILVVIALPALLLIGSNLVILKAKNHEIYSRFNSFSALIEEGNYKEAYGYMARAYRENHAVEVFSKGFESVIRLTDTWAVTKNSGKLYLCCSAPGISFAPSSTMTYGVEKNKGKWYFTGEADMWLD